jgi:hypothetical protein
LLLPFSPLEEEVGNHFFHSTTYGSIKSNNGSNRSVNLARAMSILFYDTDTQVVDFGNGVI